MSTEPLVTPPTPSQETSLLDSVLKLADSIPAMEPKKDSVLPVFMPAYKQAREKVEKASMQWATMKKSSKSSFDQIMLL